jgi:hypothetical protein
MSAWWYSHPAPDPTRRYTTFACYCTNPACSHSRRPHPITGVATYGSRFEPDDAAPAECPECGAELDTRPLFENDEPYISQEWE